MATIVFVRSPFSNYIFDEQEALLANPYVNRQGLGFFDAFKRDFWGLSPDRSIGSYRPIPNLIWRTLWHVSQAPWLHHWINVVVHAANAALICSLILRIGRERALAWLAGTCFLLSAVLTEAIAGVVGIADVLGGLGVLLGFASLTLPLPVMPLGVFASVCCGLFSKESAIVALPLLTWAALLSAPIVHARPLRIVRALAALGASAAALIFYTYFRRHFFPVPTSSSLVVPELESLPARVMQQFLHWFQQPRLPQDSINNPLADADFPHRIAGALRVYWSGLGQLLFPWKLSGDYSFAQEPVPDRLISPATLGGALSLVLPLPLAASCWLRALWLERRTHRLAKQLPISLESERPNTLALSRTVLLGIGVLWVPVAYFPHSNIPVLLPTVRAERFWYLPAIGAAIVLAVGFASMLGARGIRARAPATWLVVAFLGFNAVRARLHSCDYANDLTFWRATREAAPQSAKAHLNYSVMLGARGRLTERLEISHKALELAPHWPMAHVYYADVLCRLQRPAEAWPHYVKGFELAVNDPNLIALGLQCLWDQKSIEPHREELLKFAEVHRGSWLAYLASDIVYNGAKHGGVEKKYRPRGYDEGPKSQ